MTEHALVKTNPCKVDVYNGVLNLTIFVEENHSNMYYITMKYWGAENKAYLENQKETQAHTVGMRLLQISKEKHNFGVDYMKYGHITQSLQVAMLFGDHESDEFGLRGKKAKTNH